jgi:outer membrane protein assembly factor BamB
VFCLALGAFASTDSARGGERSRTPLGTVRGSASLERLHAIDEGDLVWPQFQGSSRHTGLSPFDAPAPGLERAWTFDMPEDEDRLSGAVVAGDLVVTVSKDRVFGLDLSSGTLRWSIERAEGPAFMPVSTPAVTVVGDTPVLLFLEGQVSEEDSGLVAYSLAADEPEHLWTQPLNDSSITGVTTAGDLAFVGDISGNAYGIRIATEPQPDLPRAEEGDGGESPGPGEESGASPSGQSGSPAATGSPTATTQASPGETEQSPEEGGTPSHEGTQGPGGEEEEDSTEGSDTGLIEWSTVTTGPAGAALAAADGVVYVVASAPTSGEASVTALDAETGDPVWPEPFGSSTVTTFASAVTVGEDALYVGFNDQTVQAVDPEDGRLLWSTRTRSVFSPSSAAAISGDAVLVMATSDNESGLYRIEADTGRRSGPWRHGAEAGVWDFDFDAPNLLGSPVVVGGAVYAGLSDGRLVALDLESGLLVWQDDRQEGALGPIAAADGLLLVPEDLENGGLHGYRHDPEAELTAVESPTKLDPGASLANYGVAVAGVAAGFFLLHLAIRAAARRPGGTGSDRSAPEGPLR